MSGTTAVRDPGRRAPARRRPGLAHAAWIALAATLGAGAAQALAEARHVRGWRTAGRYLAWLARRCRWLVLRGVWREPALPGALPADPRARPGRRRRSRCNEALERDGATSPRSTSGVAAVDPRRYNPLGWTANVERRVLALGPAARLPAGTCCRRTVAVDDRDALRRGHHLVDVASLHANARERALALARVAACGLPVRVLDEDPALAALLGRDLHRAMTAALPLDDLDRREAVSVEMRRLALRDHGRAGGDWPLVSVLLATRRPRRLAAAIANVARQDYPRLELVLALHGDGFGEVPAPGRAGLPVRVVRLGAERPLGTVLDAAATVARGELLAKMDDDDGYGAEHLTDLVLARTYSGAALVGKGCEFVYLAGRDVTVRRGRWRAERHTTDIAGGGLLFGRTDLCSAGGWRPLPRGVDQALAADVLAAGGAVYRTHGFGFLLVRHGRGHAWAARERRFLADADAVHRGWRPDLAGIGDVPWPG